MPDFLPKKKSDKIGRQRKQACERSEEDALEAKKNGQKHKSTNHP
ncbi:MAG: hypothetical protein [Microvirus sp.]|nr:MAG: hypothetical protein [Microvirus sp.]